MGTVVQRRTPRVKETHQPMPSGLQYSGFAAMSPMSLQQPGSNKTKYILSRYRPIAPKPVAGMSTDQTTTDTHSTLSTDNASTTDYKPGKRSRKRPSDSSASKSGKKKPAHKAKTEEGTPHHPVAEFYPDSSPGYDLTPLFPVGVAQKFGPGGWQRFHDSFDPRGSASGVSVSLSLSAGAQSPPELVASGLHIGVGGDDERFMDRAARLQSSFGNENEVSRSYQPRESRFLGACPSLSTSFGTDSEVCSTEGSDKPDVVTLSLLPDTPSNVKTCSTSSTLSTLSLLRSDLRWSTTAWESPATASSDLNTSLTMSSTGRWSENTTETTPVRLCCERTPAPDTSAAAVDAQELEQRHGGSSEAILLTDGIGQLLWANAAFHRLSNERTSSRLQAMGPYIDPLGIRTQLASLTFRPPFPAPKCKAVLWGFLKKFILHENTEDEH